MKRIILLFALIFGVTMGINAEKSASIFQRYNSVRGAVTEHFYGTIGSYKIEVYLKHYGHEGSEANREWEVVGKYRYIRGGKPGNWLGLTGSGAHLRGMPTVVVLDEYNAAGKLTGEWRLVSGGANLNGQTSTFTNPETGKTLRIRLSDYN